MVRPVLPSAMEVAARVGDLIQSRTLTKGAQLAAFEKAIAHHLDVKHAVGVSSCTTGLMLTYQGLGFNADVIVPSFTFGATVAALRWVGATPAFTDVNEATSNIDPAFVESAIGPTTRGVVAVHTFGNPCSTRDLEDICRERNLPLVIDAAHGFGALERGIPVGSQGNAQVFSLSPTKLLVAGEGGIVATNDERLADYVRAGREYGHRNALDADFAGLNGRLAEFNAILALMSLSGLDAAVEHRNVVATRYRRKLAGLPGLRFQHVDAANRSSYKDMAVFIDPTASGVTRSAVARHLANAGVETRAYYDPPAHRQVAYREFAPAQPLVATEVLSATCLCLPIWSDMDLTLVDHVCDLIADVWRAETEDKAP